MVLGMVVYIMFCGNVVIGEVCMSNKRDTTGSGSIEFPQLPLLLYFMYIMNDCKISTWKLPYSNNQHEFL